MNFEVVHRAVPHIADWDPLNPNYLDPCSVWLVTHREPYALYSSQVRHHQATSLGHAMSRTASAYTYIWREATKTLPMAHSTTYESLFNYRGVRNLAHLLGYDGPPPTPLEDRNRRYQP
jgi:hypothetical protein